MDNMEIARLINELVGGGGLSDETERERLALLAASAHIYSYLSSCRNVEEAVDIARALLAEIKGRENPSSTAIQTLTGPDKTSGG